MKSFLSVILCVAALTVAGCYGVPNTARSFGGGKEINFVAPANGYLYIVVDNKLTETRSMKKDEEFKASYPNEKTRIYFDYARGLGEYP